MVQTSIEKALTFVVGDFTNNFEDPNKQALSNWLQQMEALRRTDYDQARAYYGGDHPVRLTDRLRKFLGSEMKFRDNYMEVVVDALAKAGLCLGLGHLAGEPYGRGSFHHPHRRHHARRCLHPG